MLLKNDNQTDTQASKIWLAWLSQNYNPIIDLIYSHLFKYTHFIIWIYNFISFHPLFTSDSGEPCKVSGIELA